MSQKGKAIGAAAIIVMLGMALSRVLGFVRWQAVFHVFGRNEGTDALFAAFTLPDLLYILVSGGALGAAFVPIFTEIRQRGEEQYAWDLANGLINLVSLAVLVLVVLGIVFAPWLLRVLAPGFDPDSATFVQAVLLSQLLFPMVFFTSASGLMNGLLQGLGEFKAPALAWSLYNAVIIGVTLLLGPSHGLKAVCWGTVLGAISMVVVQGPGLVKRGWRPAWKLNLKDENLRKAVRLFFPAMLSIGLSQVSLMVLPTLFGSFLSKGDIGSMNLANRLVLLPLGLFGNAIAMAIFPALCQDQAEGNQTRFANTLNLGLRAGLVLCVPMMILFMGSPETLIRALFVTGGKFEIADATATAEALRWLSLGLVGYILQQVLTKGFHAKQNTATPLRNNLFCLLVITLPLTGLLLHFMGGARSVCLGLSLGVLLSGFALMIQLIRQGAALSARDILVSIGKMSVASLPLLGLALGLESWAKLHNPGNLSLLLALGVAFGLGGVAYVIALVVLKEKSAALALRRIPKIGPKLAARIGQ